MLNLYEARHFCQQCIPIKTSARQGKCVHLVPYCTSTGIEPSQKVLFDDV